MDENSLWLSSPSTCADICYTQTVAVLRNARMNHVAEGPDPEAVQQVHSEGKLESHRKVTTRGGRGIIPVDVEEVSGEDIIILGCRCGIVGFRSHRG